MKLHHTIAAAVIAAQGLSAQAADFTVSSKTIQAGATIGADLYWNNFGCEGKNQMPDLNWSGAPTGTKSFAVTFYDKDAPTGSGFWHCKVDKLSMDKGASPALIGFFLRQHRIGQTELTVKASPRP
ncbi:hypothetical protein [Hydrogenophaga luteola]|uniref:Avidin n=1 Tax=Hydrogenophaga luteola TaxID=1591122 RepID=A0ABV7W7A8_9BURK